MSNFEDNKFDEFMRSNTESSIPPKDEWRKIQSFISNDIEKGYFWFKRKVHFATVAASILFAVITINTSIYENDEIIQLVEMTDIEDSESLLGFNFEEEK